MRSFFVFVTPFCPVAPSARESDERCLVYLVQH
jgi:hypothetical protein